VEPTPLSTFAAIVGGSLTGEPAGDDRAILQVATHSDRIGHAGVFFALSGSRTDGHEFVQAAFENGAVAAVVRRDFSPARPVRGPLVAVEDPLRALQELAAWWRRSVRAHVVAVVGSNGKTVTKDALVHFAGYGATTYGSPGSYNSQLGVALSVLGCPRECDLAVIEVSVSDPGEMALMRDVVRPDSVVVTNLGSRWQSHFTDRSHLARELLSIATAIGPDGWVMIGHDDDELARASGSVLAGERMVMNRSAALPRFSAPRRQSAGLVVDVDFPDGTARGVCVRTQSEEILSDVELAISAAWRLGGDAGTLLSAVDEYAPTATRLEIWRSPRGTTLIRDVATPDPIAVGSAIRTARRVVSDTGGHTAIVLGQSAERWEEAGAPALARLLVNEGVDAFYGLDVGFNRRLATAVRASSPDLPVRLFATADDLRDSLLSGLGRDDVALVQAAPDSSMGDLSTALIEAMAPTRLYVDVPAIAENVRAFRRLVGPSVRILAMVKALAYGTDMVNVASCLQDAGVDMLGVAGADEGAALRRAGIGLPILVMLGSAGEMSKLLRHRLTPVVYSPEVLESLLTAQPATERTLAVHVEVDTGMHRTGFPPADAIEVVRRLHSTPGVEVQGLMTHLACAGDPPEDAFTRGQLARFRRVLAAANEMGVRQVIRHAAATAAAIRFPESHFDMVRIGLGLHGIHPSPATRGSMTLIPACGLVSSILEIVTVPGGERVGYGGTYTAPPEGGRIGVVPAGYHDCVPIGLSNVGRVIVAGVECPIVGRVSMDSMTIDVSSCPQAQVGSDVLVYGRYGSWLRSFEDVAESIGTIPWELMARIGPRVQRIFSSH
jgi:Alr-MurF fusion protein